MAETEPSELRVGSADADDVWQSLLASNRLFASGARRHPRQSIGRRRELIAGQHPRAVVIGCSDSRVPPELVFGSGLGDLFVIRSAGQVLDDAGYGSLEYAVTHLGTSLVVVLGHSGCGALAAAVKGDQGAGHLRPLLTKLRPAVEMAAARPGDILENAVDDNIRHQVSHLRRLEPLLAGLVASAQIRLVGARYDLGSGLVTPVQ